MLHELKTDPMAFDASWEGKKNYEIRYHGDRQFSPGDVLRLRETAFSGEEMKNGEPLVYTGRIILAKVVLILSGPIYGLQKDWSILSVEITAKVS